MPYTDPDPSDPSMLVGVELPAEEGTELEMAYAFAEEFARLGFSEARLLALFHHPFYAGAYRTLAALGEEKIKSIIAEAVGFWGKFPVQVQDQPDRERLDIAADSLRSASRREPQDNQKRGRT